MAIRGEASATLADGRVLRLVVNFATLARAAAETGIPAGELFAVLRKDDGRQMLALAALAEQAVRTNHPEIDSEEVGELMLLQGEALGGALAKALAGAFGKEAETSDKNANPPRKRGTGTSSKPRGRKRA